MRRWVIWVLALLVAGFVVLQVVPYGRAHANPPVVAVVQWDSVQTEELFVRACADCHSNETQWPWYSQVAPVSWLVQHDVEEGRSVFNISNGDSGEEAGEAAEVVQEGEMPPSIYLLTHSEARLTDAEREELVQGLVATFGSEHGARSEDGDDGEHEDEEHEGDDD